MPAGVDVWRAATLPKCSIFWPGWEVSLALVHSDACRVVALDLPGFGQSDWPAVRYDLEFFAELLDRFLRRLHMEHAVVIGHSLGAAIALQLAASFSRRISKLAMG